MTVTNNVRLVLDVFSAIEQHDDQRFRELLNPDFEIAWPPSLPYGGMARGAAPPSPSWSDTWLPLQPTAAERRMDARVVAASDDEVVVLWRQRGVTAGGARFDGEVLGLYRVWGGKLAHAQMFYFDTAQLVGFLARAKAEAPVAKR
jgi:ketosteroid isomerase-like protein